MIKKQTIYLQYVQKYNVFALKDEVVEKLATENIVPEIVLGAADYARLGEKMPAENAPIIGFLCCREENMYSVDFNYAKSLVHSGADLRFLTYKNVVQQMEHIDGLMLPGGRFPSPEEFYIDGKKTEDGDGRSLERAYAYIDCIKEAESRGLPIFGVCAGAQMLGAVHGMKLYRNAHQYIGTDIEHKTTKLQAHTVKIKENSMLHKLIGLNEIMVNSRHIEALVNDDKQNDLSIFATAPDGVPEAWGSEEKGILCIQWHPEDFAANGDKTMQKLYDWLINEAKKHI